MPSNANAGERVKAATHSIESSRQLCTFSSPDDRYSVYTDARIYGGGDVIMHNDKSLRVREQLYSVVESLLAHAEG